MDREKWEAMNVVTTGVGVKGTLFYIPLYHAPGQMLRLYDSRLEVVVPHIYDRFIGEWSQFPHHK